MIQNRINIMQPSVPSVEVVAPQNPEVEYASVTERFVALLIDYGIIFIPCQFLLGMWVKFWEPELDIWQYLIWVSLVNGLFILYETVFSCADRMTLGKALVGIAVVKKDLSGPVSWFQAFVRVIGYYISGGLLMCGFLLAFFDDRHRALHDILSGSVVVQIRQKSTSERLVVRLLGGILLAAFAWTVYAQFFGAGALLDQYYIRHARLHLYKVAALEEMHHLKYGYYTNDLLRLALLSGDPV
ncbi:MAG: RDD family protein, partial [Elusimicrobiaceae bacterium]|nr:RDD family protein [Elusimicrobiaceae bacterium]